MAVLTPTFTNGTTNIVPDFRSSDFISGFEQTITGNLTLTLAPGIARAYNNSFGIDAPANTPLLSTPITIDASTIGANGCFPFSLADAAAGVNTLFPVYVQGVQSGIVSAGDVSPSTAKTVGTIVTGNNFQLPNFSAWRRVGSVYYDATNNLLFPVVQTGHHNVREYMLATPVNILLNDAATVLTPIVLNSGAFPIDQTVATQLTLRHHVRVAGVGDSSIITPLLVVSLNNYPVMTQPETVGADLQVQVRMPFGLDVNGNPVIYHANLALGSLASIWIAGWTEDYGVNAV